MKQGIVLGVIADDFTGATDVAGMLVQAGMKTLLTIGVPEVGTPDADAVVVALKTRTVPATEAVAKSLAAFQWLRGAGAQRFYFKYCSTFDSTSKGNIGPVIDALMEALGTDFTIACPAFPVNGRTIYRGHLFVGDQLLSDSGMRNHPLTPMRDANLVRVLQSQYSERVGLLRHDVILQGAPAVQKAIDGLMAQGVRVAIADCLADADLHVLAQACADFSLVTAGSGLALGLPKAYRERGWLQHDPQAAKLDRMVGRSAILSGSCSEATNAQVQAWRGAGKPAQAIDPRALARGEPVIDRTVNWARERLDRGPVLIYATTGVAELEAVQTELGMARAGELVESALAQIARRLIDSGVQRLIVAGGETSGAVVQALRVEALRIGPAICPGVPWTQVVGRPLWLALKSGNFGGPEFFADAFKVAASSS
jgi:3-dehydrotetronate 4-kinase